MYSIGLAGVRVYYLGLCIDDVRDYGFLPVWGGQVPRLTANRRGGKSCCVGPTRPPPPFRGILPLFPPRFSCSTHKGAANGAGGLQKTIAGGRVGAGTSPIRRAALRRNPKPFRAPHPRLKPPPTPHTNRYLQTHSLSPHPATFRQNASIPYPSTTTLIFTLSFPSGKSRQSVIVRSGVPSARK